MRKFNVTDREQKQNGNYFRTRLEYEQKLLLANRISSDENRDYFQNENNTGYLSISVIYSYAVHLSLLVMANAHRGSTTGPAEYFPEQLTSQYGRQ